MTTTFWSRRRILTAAAAATTAATLPLATTARALEVISFGESAIADEGAGDAGEGEEMNGLSFVA
ncbi:hypothetical protein, partial [Streptomyces sp. NPDC005281]|uniref:hypothetical protein n=1 Tax=Streptomyces sp. NPDC005281 TaxID=3155712 RepID=UPI0033BB94E2